MSTEMLNNPIIIQNEQEAIQFIRAIRKSKRANKKLKERLLREPLDFELDKLLESKKI